VGVDVPRVVKDRTSEPVSYERQLHWKTQFLVERQQRQTSNWKSGHGIAWPGLVQRETSNGGSTTCKKPLGQPNIPLPALANRLFHGKPEGARKHERPSEARICRILERPAEKAGC